jgi:hypothetical protein
VSGARVVYFTAGTVGAGHLARGVAIRRALARAGSNARFAIVAPGRRPAFTADAELHTVAIDHVELAEPARAAGSELARVLGALSPDVLLVDLFWAPLRHLLPLVGCEAWLLVRRAPAAWFVGPQGLPFERSQFARVIAIEPGLEAARPDETIDPVVTVNHDEMHPDGALRARLGVPLGEPIHVIHQAGEAGEWRALVDARRERPVHVFTWDGAAGEAVPDGVTVHDGAALFPLAAWLSDAATLASGAGYNAFWEARWLGWAGKTVFVPFARRIDDQAWRLATSSTCIPRRNGADVLATRLR